MAEQQIIVVATDLSQAARAAFAQAFRIAGQTGASVRVVSVVEKDDIAGLAKSSGISREDAEAQVVSTVTERLDAEIEAAMQESGLSGSAERGVLVGRATREIVACCKDVGATLLVMGYNGWGEERGGPGGVAAACARQAPCDVLLARAGKTGPFQKIAVAMDFSACSEQAAAAAAEYAKRDGGEVVLLHAHSNPYDSPMLSGSASSALMEYQKYAASLQGDLDQEVLKVHDRASGRASGTLLEDVKPARAISGWCSKNGADLTVLGAMGWSALRHALMGSTADKVLRETPSAVLVVRGG